MSDSGPARQRAPRLAEAVAVILVDPGRGIWLECATCSERWSPNTPQAGGGKRHGQWRCPNDCTPSREEAESSLLENPSPAG